MPVPNGIPNGIPNGTKRHQTARSADQRCASVPEADVPIVFSSVLVTSLVLADEERDQLGKSRYQAPPKS